MNPLQQQIEALIIEIDRCARVLQKSYCGYSTTEGDSRTCDCKFAFDLEKQEYAKELDTWKGNSECTGCAEARRIIWNTEQVKQSLPKLIELIEKDTRERIVTAIKEKNDIIPEIYYLRMVEVINNLINKE